MDGFMVWAWIISIGAGICLGIFIGEDNKVREHRQTPLYERAVLEKADITWFYASLFAVLFAIVLTLISANPAEELIERADQIRSSNTEH